MIYFGYTKLPRSIMKWKWIKNPNTLLLYILIKSNVNVTDETVLGVKILKGQMLTSLDSLSKNSGLSIQQVRTALKNLKSTNDITVKTCPLYSIITLVEKEDLSNVANNLTDTKQTNNKPLLCYQQQSTKENNNKKNINNINNNYTSIAQDDILQNTTINYNIQKIIDLFKNTCFNLNTDFTPTNDDTKNILKLFKKYSIDEIKSCFEYINENKFLTGFSSSFTASFSWIVNPINFAKIKSGKYDDFDSPFSTLSNNNFNNQITDDNKKSQEYSFTNISSIDLEKFHQKLLELPHLD